MISFGILLTVFLLTSTHGQSGDFPVLTGPYLGQEPPGMQPEVFGPGIISVDENFEHSAAVFSPDGKEVFWCTNVDWYTERKQSDMLRLYFMKMVDGKWSAPRRAPFVENLNIERPTFSPCGRWLFFEYFADPSNPDNVDIFVVERKGDAWSKPEPVSSLINTPGIERIHCFTADGSFYFSRNPFTNREEIFVSKWADGKFSKPEKLGEDYNSNDYEIAILLAPDKSYMLIESIDARHTSQGLQICYKNADGSWSDRIKTPYQHCGGFLALSPDGKYLFFLGEAIYWISTSFTEALRP
jgi:hypothetical protein